MPIRDIYTIGHSNHPIEGFIGLLLQHGITAVADVRSTPYSRFNPQYNRDTLSGSLKKAGIVYVFLGEELGARPEDPACYVDGRADFERMAGREQFRCGLGRILAGAEKYRIALMCAEKEPLDCHRTILVCRHLKDQGVCIHHILDSGSIEEHSEAEDRLLKISGFEPSLFDNADSELERLDRAYRKRAGEIAYRRKG